MQHDHSDWSRSTNIIYSNVEHMWKHPESNKKKKIECQRFKPIIIIIIKKIQYRPCNIMTDISGEAVYLWSNRAKEGTRWTVAEWWEGRGGRNRRLLTRRSLSDRHSEAGTPGLGVLQLTGSSGCQAPVGNHLPQQLDYLFLLRDAQMAPFPPSLKPSPRPTIFLASVYICL